jgi:hypothetical protein
MPKFNKCVFCSIVIPTMKHDGSPIDDAAREDAINHAMKVMAELFGGFTALPGEGGWVSPAGKLHREAVTKIESACLHEGRHYEEALSGLLALAVDLKGLLSQEAIMIAAGDSVEFV